MTSHGYTPCRCHERAGICYCRKNPCICLPDPPVEPHPPAEMTSPDGAEPYIVLRYVRHCASLWHQDARLLGNARAGDIVRAIDAYLSKDRR